MAFGQGLRQVQKQQLKLLPQQIQLMKLLQIPTANLEERIKEEIEENPALELGEEHDGQEDTDLSNQDSIDDFEYEPADTVADESAMADDGPDMTEFGSVDQPEWDPEDDIPDYQTRDINYGEGEEMTPTPIKVENNLHDLLVGQLAMLELDERRRKVAEQIVGSIDEDGYLRREIASIVDDLAFRQNVQTSDEEVELLLSQIQQLFDPAGVGARNLQECLLLQLQRLRSEGKEVQLALNAVKDYFEEFTKKHYEKIQRGLGIDEAKLREVMNQLIRLNPKPGGVVSTINKAETYVIPDFFIENINGKLELTLNNRNAPELRISSDYRDMLREYERGSKKNKQQKDAVMFIKQKIDAAKWFIDIIKQRHETLYNSMYAIMMHQQEFFLTGDETTLRPMILKDVAEVTGLDISTVSRVANSKFVQTEFGTYRLKFFFSESLSTDSGEEVSTREVKKILSDMVEGEDKRKPLSDDQLTDMLKEKGYNIARRTVAKYREQLNVPVARLRKEL
ncbi:MAG: RNA polymerase factor sigma-54 [Chitinophagaceae bacterium]|nr:RNA polymerase factor sigma-54 [Chitinophagaceae bacterium]